MPSPSSKPAPSRPVRATHLVVGLATLGGVVIILMGGQTVPIGQFAVGAILLILGGGWLVDGSVAIARSLGAPTLLIGLTVVAFGTSAPELAFNVIAAADGQTALTFGNVVGSNIANIGLVVGFTAITCPLVVHGRVVSKELPFLILVTLACSVLALVPEGVPPFGIQGIDRVDGLLMLAGFAVFMAAWYRMGRKEEGDPLIVELGAAPGKAVSGVKAWSQFVVGLAMLLGGGRMAELGAVGVATWLQLSPALIGLTIVAISTSLPELVTSIIASRKGHNDLAVGNIVGSNMFNLLLVLAVTAVIRPVALPEHGLHDLIAMSALTVLLLPFAMTRANRVTRIEGIVLLTAYVAYMTYGVLRETT